MLLKSILKKEKIIFLKSHTKESAIRELIDTISKFPAIKDKKLLEKSIFDREKLMSTGIGLQVGLPHVKIDSVSSLEISIGISKTEISNYESLDNQPVKIIFLIAAHSDQHTDYLKLLAEISRIIKNETLRESLLSSNSIEEIYDILIQGEING